LRKAKEDFMSKRLLLADDSITIQKVVQITFAHEDYELTITDNGDAALAKARELLPDLVLADVYMPGKNGYELCAAIKQEATLRQVPVLLLAGSFEPFDEGKARAAGADAWIEKPFESQALIDKVSALLSAVPSVAASVPPAVATPPAPTAAPVPVASDPFADISFDEPAVAAEPLAATPPVDDWSDLDLAPAPAVPAAPVAFAFEEPQPAAPSAFEFDRAAFAPPAEELPAATEPPPIDFDAFVETEDIMALDDDDILGAEDLEPASEMTTLTPWSRAEFSVEDVFGEAAPPEPAAEPFAPAVAPAQVAAPVPAEPSGPVTLEAPPEIAPSPAPVPMAAPQIAATSVEQRVATLTEAEIEQIIERTVGKVIEKLAGSVLERIAWEVVPDLAEALLKEEIRKIKDAAA
jgi:CheY-like chemotaxis protein